MFQISVPVEDPRRAAETLAALWGGMTVPRPQADGNWAAFGAGRMVLLRRRDDSARDGIAQLPVATPHSVEQVIEIACERGFHAEEGEDLIEFWVDEHCLFLLSPATEALNGPLPLAA